MCAWHDRTLWRPFDCATVRAEAKLFSIGRKAYRMGVAPRAGAWIETRCAASPRPQACRPSRRGVDRNSATSGTAVDSGRRPSRRGVDRNRLAGRRRRPVHVAPRAGAWIETASAAYATTWRVESPLAQGRGSKPRNLGFSARWAEIRGSGYRPAFKTWGSAPAIASNPRSDASRRPPRGTSRRSTG